MNSTELITLLQEQEAKRGPVEVLLSLYRQKGDCNDDCTSLGGAFIFVESADGKPVIILQGEPETISLSNEVEKLLGDIEAHDAGAASGA